MSATTDRAQWLKDRQSYIGGTDIAAIAGLHRYKTPYDVWAEKVLGETSNAGRKASAGVALEPLVVQWYEEDSGHTVTRFNEPIFYAGSPMLGANVDGIVEGSHVVEVKTYDFSTKDNWGEPGTDQIPEHYWCQAQWYTGFTRLPYCLVIALDRGTMEYTEYRVNRSHEMFCKLVAKATRFWNDHIVTGNAPTLLPMDAKRIIDIYPVPEPELIDPSEAMLDMIAELKSLKEAIGPMEQRKKLLTDTLTVAIGPADGINTDDGPIKLARVQATGNRRGYTTLKTPWK